MKNLVLFVTLLSMSGCDGAAPGDPESTAATGPGLETSEWRLREYLSEAGGVAPVLPHTTIEARFRDGRIDGSAGCNRYFGAYTIGEQDGLTFAPEIGSTQMACPPPIARQEQRYLALLSRVAAWNRQDDSLVLLDESREPLLKFAVVSLLALTDSAWQATGINNGSGGVVSSETTHLATASFGEGEISGNAGCNRFTAPYELDGERITIGPAATTRMHCPEPEGIMEQERQYLEALTRARRYTVSFDRLELRDENDSLQVGYRIRED